MTTISTLSKDQVEPLAIGGGVKQPPPGAAPDPVTTTDTLSLSKEAMEAVEQDNEQENK